MLLSNNIFKEDINCSTNHSYNIKNTDLFIVLFFSNLSVTRVYYVYLLIYV